MTTAMDIIQGAAEELGVYGVGEVMSAADTTRGLSVLNDMVDMWSNESLFCYAILEQSVALTVGKSSYTIGTSGGADLPITRPIRILDGPGTAYVQDTNGNNYGMAVVPRDTWNMLGNRSNLITSNFPDTLFYDPQFPLGVINIFPVPNIQYTMFFDSYQQISEFASLSTAVSLPPGYNAALRHNLAIELQPFFADAKISPVIVELAGKSKGAIKRANMRPNVAVMEPEIVSKSNVSYNPYTDRPGSSAF